MIWKNWETNGEENACLQIVFLKMIYQYTKNLQMRSNVKELDILIMLLISYHEEYIQFSYQRWHNHASVSTKLDASMIGKDDNIMKG